MDRREFIKKAGVGFAAGSVLGTPAIARAQKKFKWKMVTTWPPNFPVFHEGVVRFAGQVKELTEGAIDIRVYAGGSWSCLLQAFDAVSQGTVERRTARPTTRRERLRPRSSSPPSCSASTPRG
jgi:TRAP-type mannitol/chloroaromatic compound transport system substrate-binding protein